jgi:hypothetical protein
MRTMTLWPARSRKIRRILRLESRAAKLQRRLDRARARAELFRRRREACFAEARAIEGTLTDGQLGVLQRMRQAEA